MIFLLMITLNDKFTGPMVQKTYQIYIYLNIAYSCFDNTSIMLDMVLKDRLTARYTEKIRFVHFILSAIIMQQDMCPYVSTSTVGYAVLSQQDAIDQATLKQAGGFFMSCTSQWNMFAAAGIYKKFSSEIGCSQKDIFNPSRLFLSHLTASSLFKKRALLLRPQ